MSNKKKCPLFTIALSITLKDVEVEAQSCLEEMCAFWNTKTFECGLIK